MRSSPDICLFNSYLTSSLKFKKQVTMLRKACQENVVLIKDFIVFSGNCLRLMLSVKSGN